MPVVESAIRSVTLYRRGAEVTRSATVSADGEAVFEGLPLTLADDSVRVTLDSNSLAHGTRVFAVQVSVDIPQPDDALAPARREELEAARRSLDALREEIDDIEASVTRLRKVELQRRKGPGRGQPPSTIPIEGRLMWIAFVNEQLEHLEARRAQLEARAFEASQTLQSLEQADQAASTARNPRAFEPRKRVALQVEGVEDTATLSLTYRVSGVRWAPSYVMRLEGERARLQMRAVVAQRTGEDWSGVALTVSTASAQQWFALPKLDAIRIGRRQPPPRSAGWREPPANVDALFEDYDRARADLPSQDTSLVLHDGPGMVAVAGALSEDEPHEMTQALGGMDAPPLSPPPAPHAVAAPATRAVAVEPPAAPPQQAPMPELEMARARKSSGILSAFGSAGSDATAPGSVGMRAEPEPAPVPPPEVDRAWSDYGSLRLRGCDSPARGRLRPTRTQGGERRASAAALRAVRAIDSMPAPGKHHWVESQQGYDYAYPCEVQASVPSDGAPHVVSVLEADADVQRRYVCVAGISEDVFRIAVAHNPLQAPLPHGPLDVYLEDTYVLTSQIDGTAPGGRMELGLGVEPAIKVARNVAFVEDSEGLLKKQNAYVHRIAVDVQNLTAQAAKVEVRERVPVPARRDDEDIEVAESSVDPPWDPYEPKGDPLRGGRRWSVTVPAGEQVELKATWTIRVPGGSELVGGNRRER